MWIRCCEIVEKKEDKKVINLDVENFVGNVENMFRSKGSEKRRIFFVFHGFVEKLKTSPLFRTPVYKERIFLSEAQFYRSRMFLIMSSTEALILESCFISRSTCCRA